MSAAAAPQRAYIIDFMSEHDFVIGDHNRRSISCNAIGRLRPGKAAL